MSGTNEPVAWAVTPTGKREEIDCEFVYPSAATAGDVALSCNGVVVPLYRSTALTDAEWDEIEGMVSDYQEIAEFNEERCHPHYAEKARRRAAMLIGLLERLG